MSKHGRRGFLGRLAALATAPLAKPETPPTPLIPSDATKRECIDEAMKLGTIQAHYINEPQNIGFPADGGDFPIPKQHTLCTCDNPASHEGLMRFPRRVR